MVTRKTLNEMDSTKPICLLWNGHKSGFGLLEIITKRKTLSTVQEINSKSSEEELFLVLRPNIDILKQGEHQRMNKLTKIHNCQFSKDWVFLTVSIRTDLWYLTKALYSKIDFTKRKQNPLCPFTWFPLQYLPN